LPDDITVTRVVGFDIETRRSKIAGKNSRLDVHGDRATDRMLRIYTNTGLEGVGNCRVDREAGQKLLGTNPFALYESEQNRMRGPLGSGTMPLWDLLGRALGKPVFEILGGRGPDRVPVYDGSIYFADLLPQYSDRWQHRFREEIDMGLAIGHRAFKVKVGRGAKWMPRGEGDDRDVEVLHVIREHSADILIGIDANNGYDLAGTKRLFQRIGDLDVAFAEEMFPETVEEDLEFKAFLKDNGWNTLVADGETQREIDVFKPFMRAKAIDVYQGDMNRFGFEGILAEASWADDHGLLVAPHNWGSLVGFYMQLQVGRAIPNFYRAEHDPLSSDVLVADGYAIEGGVADVPDAPGTGITIDETRFASEATIRFDVSL
jgi:L-alanine-DL-glutamate epimerase-like enolase superfamily enzyme